MSCWFPGASRQMHREKIIWRSGPFVVYFFQGEMDPPAPSSGDRPLRDGGRGWEGSWRSFVVCVFPVQSKRRRRGGGLEMWLMRDAHAPHGSVIVAHIGFMHVTRGCRVSFRLEPSMMPDLCAPRLGRYVPEVWRDNEVLCPRRDQAADHIRARSQANRGKWDQTAVHPQPKRRQPRIGPWSQQLGALENKTVALRMLQLCSMPAVVALGPKEGDSPGL